LLVLILLVASLPGLGLAKGGEIPLYLVQVHGLLTAFLILLMLQYRKHVQQARQRDTALALERSQLQAIQERGIREEQEKLLAMLAHELKTPLSTMHMRLDADAQGSREIRHAIRDMNAVIERCLQTAQFSDRQLQANLTPVDLVGVLQDVVSASAEPARVVMQAPDRWTVQTDQQLMHIVLSNLIENGCKYAEPNSPIEVKLFSALAADGVTQKICFEISNLPGRAGWPEASQVFEKYYRSPHARRQAGTGLGLYLVRNLVQVLGGQIDYAPDESHVRFVVCLPL
jgi:signal transduction histidine kinase